MNDIIIMVCGFLLLYCLAHYIRLKRQYDFYLAGPMRGYPDGNKDRFIAAADQIRAMGCSVWNPAEQNDTGHSFSFCIKKDLDAIMHQCRAIALLPGWRNSLGANIETFCAYASAKQIALIIERPDGKIHLKPFSHDDLMLDFNLPFGLGHDEFRRSDELEVPEQKIFDANCQQNYSG